MMKCSFSIQLRSQKSDRRYEFVKAVELPFVPTPGVYVQLGIWESSRPIEQTELVIQDDRTEPEAELFARFHEEFFATDEELEAVADGYKSWDWIPVLKPLPLAARAMGS